MEGGRQEIDPAGRHKRSGYVGRLEGQRAA